MEDANARVVESRKALPLNDLDRIRREAHTIKGAASSLGLTAIRDACLSLESAARSGSGAEL